MGESRLVVDTASCTIFSLSKVSNNEARLANVGNDGIIYLIHIWLPINANCFETGTFNRGLKASFEGFLCCVVNPHCNKSLLRIRIVFDICYSGEAFNSNNQSTRAK